MVEISLALIMLTANVRVVKGNSGWLKVCNLVLSDVVCVNMIMFPR